MLRRRTGSTASAPRLRARRRRANSDATSPHSAAAASSASTLARNAAKRALVGGAEDAHTLSVFDAQFAATRTSSAVRLAEVASLLRVERAILRICLATSISIEATAEIRDLESATTELLAEAKTGKSTCLRMGWRFWDDECQWIPDQSECDIGHHLQLQ